MLFQRTIQPSSLYSYSLGCVSLAAVVLLSALPACSQQPENATKLKVCGADINIRYDGQPKVAIIPDLNNWVRRAAEAVCTYYGKFPVRRLTIDVRLRGRPGVHAGTTYPDDGGYIDISAGPETTAAQLGDDWMLTHEMIHLAFPSMSRRHHWIEEGISVYVEPVARVQAGQLTAERMWSDVVRDMWQGEPQDGDRGLDNTHTWGRTYWGGALFCLQADLRIRQQTKNKKGLQDALRGILNAGGNITQDWDIEKALAVGDKATGTTVLVNLYREMGDQPKPIDLTETWKQMGIQRKPDGTVTFDARAPLAAERDAITRKP